MIVTPYFITSQGYEKLVEAIDKLKNVERPKIVEEVAKARTYGDLSENAEYDYAEDKRNQIDREISNLADILSRAEVVDTTKLSGDKVIFGAIVTLEDDDTEKQITYKIVSDYEADIEQGLIAINSPIAREILGKSQGDSIDISTPGGEKSYTVLRIDFK